jgi:epsilon-lactone hydrolase
MPSQAMRDAIAAIRNRRQASAGQAPPALEERRAAFTPGDRLYPVPDDVLVTEVNAGGVPAHWLAAPGADVGRVLLFLHGGGFEFGSVRSDGELAARLGRASGMRVLFPEYRLAPEHPFPAAIDDVLAAWRWLRSVQALGARSIAVAGDSAGGGLAVALLVAARDAGEALPAAAVLMSPTVDLTSSGASMTERADQDPISTPAMLRQFASDYLAGADPTTPLAGRGGGRSRGRRYAGDRGGPAPRLPAHARHARGSRSLRANREVPAGPGSLTRQSIDSCERRSSDAS